MTNRSMELEIWDGDWGLPSVDMDCLQILVYCQLSGAPVQVKIRNNPFQGALPTFRHGKVTLHKLEDVVSYLQTRSFNADHKLSKKNISEIQAYSHLLREKLYPAIQFVSWVDKKNSIGLTKAWYANKLWFPFSFYYPGRYEGNAKNYITALYGSLEEDIESIEIQDVRTDLESGAQVPTRSVNEYDRVAQQTESDVDAKKLKGVKVYSDAEKCLTLLSNRLGDSKFFFGNQPSSLDAIIYSYLAPLLKAPFPNPALQNHLKACGNLVSFVTTITQKYFPAVSEEYEKKRKEEAEKRDDSDFPNRKRNRFIAGLVAMIAMSAYALISGLVEVNIVNDDKDDNDGD